MKTSQKQKGLGRKTEKVATRSEPMQMALRRVGAALCSHLAFLSRLRVRPGSSNDLRQAFAIAKELTLELILRTIPVLKAADLTLDQLRLEWLCAQSPKWTPPPQRDFTIPPVPAPRQSEVDLRIHLFEIGLDLHRHARDLYLESRQVEVPHGYFDQDRAKLPLPGPRELEWDLADSCDAAHEALWRIANRLIAASKTTLHSPASTWHEDLYDENKILAVPTCDLPAGFWGEAGDS